MPALKMKAASVTCMKDGSIFHSCRESSNRCKRKHSLIEDSLAPCLKMIRGAQYGCCEVEEATRSININDAGESEKLGSANSCECQEAHESIEDEGSTKGSSQFRSSSNVETTVESCSIDCELGAAESFPSRCPSDLDNNVESCSVDYEISAADSAGNEYDNINKENENDPDGANLMIDDSEDRSADYFSHQLSQVSDLFVSNGRITGMISDEINGFDDILKSSIVQEFDDMMFDITGNCTALPYLETVDTSFMHSRDFDGGCFTNSEISGIQSMAHQTKSCNQALIDSDEPESFDPQTFIRNFLDLSNMETNLLPALLSETNKPNRVTLVLDLDETMVHSSLQPCENADFTFKLSNEMAEHIVYVRQRPFLKPFLERVSQMFEIVVYTAGQSNYAKQLLDILDPDRKIFSRRAYRESCIFSDGCYTKDLRIFGVDLSKVAIIDNSPQVFQLQVENGIPIKSWFDDPSDNALISLLPFLETLADADDVRPIIAKKFAGKQQ